MTLHMEIQTAPGGAFVPVDLVALRVAQVKLSIGYSHPAELSWVMYQPQQSYPLGIGNFLRFWDDEFGTAEDPQFEGFIDEVSPGDDANLVQCRAFDPTQKASKEIPVMSAPWREVGGFIVEAIGAVPRLVYNVKIDNDVDYAFERGHDGTVGEIVAGLLEDALLPLRYFHAAPEDGQAYEATDLADFVYRPQEKMVFESETIRAAIDRLIQQWEPAVRMVFHPGENQRKWRFINLYNTPAVTLTLNDFSGENRVLSVQMQRSIEERYTAVRFYGPETTVLNVFSTQDGSLTPVDPPTVLETVGTVEIKSWSTWQITDPQVRRGAKLLPEETYVPVGSYWFVPSRSPTLQISYDNGFTWATVQGVRFDFQNGIATVGAAHNYVYVDPPINGRHFFVPNAVRLYWASYAEPLSVRSPPTGFSGTAYTIANLQTELRQYDEMLAVGYEHGIPVTTATRLAQFEKLAEIMQIQRRDIVYTGGCTLDGIRYEFQRLNKAVNFAAVDGDGSPVSTGWENIGAILTDVEYDYDQGLTTLQFSSDQLELVGMNVEFLKARLKIRALEQRKSYRQVLHFRTYQSKFGPALRDLAGVSLLEETYYVDPETGEIG